MDLLFKMIYQSQNLAIEIPMDFFYLFTSANRNIWVSPTFRQIHIWRFPKLLYLQLFHHDESFIWSAPVFGKPDMKASNKWRYPHIRRGFHARMVIHDFNVTPFRKPPCILESNTSQLQTHRERGGERWREMGDRMDRWIDPSNKISALVDSGHCKRWSYCRQNHINSTAQRVGDP